MNQSPPIISDFVIHGEQEPGKQAYIVGRCIDWEEMPDGSPLEQSLMLKKIEGNVATLLVMPNDGRLNGQMGMVEYPVILGRPLNQNALDWAHFLEQNPRHIASPFMINHASPPLDLSGFKGVIEDWAAIKTDKGIRLFGEIHGHGGALAPVNIIPPGTSPAVQKNGNWIVTGSGSQYALGMPSKKFSPLYKEALLSTLPDISGQHDMRHEPHGFG